MIVCMGNSLSSTAKGGWGGECMAGGGDKCAQGGHMVNEQAVRILLECILVIHFIKLRAVGMGLQWDQN